MTHDVWLWGVFNVFVLAMLVLDLRVFHRHAHEVRIKEALLWSLFWVVLSLLFNVGIYLFEGSEVALQFFTGYLIEKSLSVDNLFVFLVIFSYFKVPKKYQHKVLFWGILGALIMRGALIFLGVALINKFHWVLYIFGAFLVFTGVKMAFQDETVEIHPENNLVVQFFKKFIPVTAGYHEGKFFVRVSGKMYATLLFVVIIIVETTDLVFALDSIPAIFAITRDPFIVYTSNVFAILGLRALYFALAGLLDLFRYLKFGLSIVLAFIGVKMLIEEIYDMPITIALGVVAGVLTMSILASLFIPKKSKPPVLPPEVIENLPKK
ncbi:MAG: TerC family protein [Ignavibacteriales bacterium]|nr:TerC family protein [Ignavibacteriales bacterium]